LDANDADQAGMLSATMAQVVLVGKDWQTRALLRAQLIEEGLEVEAAETVREALPTLQEPALRPSLLIADVSASDDPSADIEQLAAWEAQIPVWIIAGRNLLAEPQLKGRGFELILVRPIDVGKLVEEIKRRIEA
jgi:DNA-binding NtrC family response regulator